MDEKVPGVSKGLGEQPPRKIYSDPKGGEQAH